MSGLDEVRAAREVLGDREHWCRGYRAKRLEGAWGWVPCDPSDPRAEQFCLYGALQRQGTEGTKLVYRLGFPQARNTAYVEMANFNDRLRGETDHYQAVIDLLDQVLDQVLAKHAEPVFEGPCRWTRDAEPERELVPA